MRLSFTLLCLAACLPQVGPPVGDASANGGGAGGGGGTAGGGSAGGNPGCPGFAGCSSFTAASAVSFDNGAETYLPKCLRITAGQPVTFTGDFANHPLEQACGPAVVLGQLSGTTAQYVFTVPGVYGYFCNQHGASTGAGMAGAIEVVP